MNHTFLTNWTLELLSLGATATWLLLLTSGYLLARYSDQWGRTLLRVYMHTRYRNERYLCRILLTCEVAAGAGLVYWGSDAFITSIFGTRILMNLVRLPKVLAAASRARSMRYGTPDDTDPTMHWYLSTWFVDLSKRIV